ncbi:MAG: metal ABC transporter substrate-binding protein [Anaerolineae bacterium]
MSSRLIRILLAALTLALILSACGAWSDEATPPPVSGAPDQVAGNGLPETGDDASRLRIVATTSIVADLVRNVAGDRVDLTALLPVGTDPHAFEPTPREVAAISEADLIIANGAHLEEFLESLLSSAGEDVPVAYLAEGVALRTGESREGEDEEDTEGVDPHIWTSPANAIIMVGNIERALSDLDPANAATYRANAAAYTQQLEELDAWIAEQVERVPPERRRLVSDHLSFGYFAERYDFELVGAVIPGFSTASAPSAQQLAQLQDAILEQGVAALFVGQDTNPNMVERIAEDTGIQVVVLYDGSLGLAGSGADTYLGFMRHNTLAIVEALR